MPILSESQEESPPTTGSLARFDLVPAEMEWHQDLPSDLDTFARLTKAGHFAHADAFYKELLKPREPLFPVVAEYGDMLLKQGAFGNAEAHLKLFMNEHHDIYNEHEIRVLELMYGISIIHTSLRLSDAVGFAESALSKLGVLDVELDLNGITVSLCAPK